MQFKKLIGGTAVTLSSDGNAITINSTATGLPLLQVFADNNNTTLDANNTTLSIQGGNLVTTNLTGSTITINSETSLLMDLNPRLGANLDGNNKEIVNTSDIKSNVYGIDIRTMDGVQPFITMDVGTVNPTNLTSILAHLLDQLIIDYGTIGATNTTPTSDMGVLS
jgi:hypothetical protein